MSYWDRRHAQRSQISMAFGFSLTFSVMSCGPVVLKSGSLSPSVVLTLVLRAHLGAPRHCGSEYQPPPSSDSGLGCLPRSLYCAVTFSLSSQLAHGFSTHVLSMSPTSQTHLLQDAFHSTGGSVMWSQKRSKKPDFWPLFDTSFSSATCNKFSTTTLIILQWAPLPNPLQTSIFVKYNKN